MKKINWFSIKFLSTFCATFGGMALYHSFIKKSTLYLFIAIILIVLSLVLSVYLKFKEKKQ